MKMPEIMKYLVYEFNCCEGCPMNGSDGCGGNKTEKDEQKRFDDCPLPTITHMLYGGDKNGSGNGLQKGISPS